jgi:hypothetical protein
MAQVARTRAERDGVNWARVAALVDSGVTVDFAPIAVPGVFVDDFRRVAARSRTAIPGDFARVDSWVVGPADSTNAFLGWVNTPVSQRVAFQLRTRDRRIQGAAVGSNGKYIGYTASNRFQDSRGTYHQSRYWYLRSGTLESWQSGPQPELLRAEMDLLKAEALVRLGRAAEAVPLVNRTRVANGELPPVTVDGPPNVAGCVPRKLDGGCGSLWDALRYEKRLEVLGIHPPGGYLDARGWQTLAAGRRCTSHPRARAGHPAAAALLVRRRRRPGERAAPDAGALPGGAPPLLVSRRPSRAPPSGRAAASPPPAGRRPARGAGPRPRRAAAGRGCAGRRPPGRRRPPRRAPVPPRRWTPRAPRCST